MKATRRGKAGSEGQNVGEVWEGGGDWFFIEIVPASGQMCIILGGHGDVMAVKEGQPT